MPRRSAAPREPAARRRGIAEPFKSFAVRSSIVSALAVLVVCVLAFLMASWAAQSELEDYRRAERRRDLLNMIEGYFGAKDFASLVELVQRLSSETSDNKVRLLLRHGSGRVLAGNLEAGAAQGDGCAVRPLLAARFLVCTTPVRGLEGMAEPTVLVGAVLLTDPPGQDRWRLIAILIMAAIAVPATALIGYMFSRRLERRLAAIASDARAVMEGDLTRRLPVQGSNDELDRLVRVVNAMLERVDGLVAELRHVTDDIAHDLRSPLGRVRKELEDALGRPRAPDADEASLQRSIEDLDAVLGTFEDILYIARLTSEIDRPPAGLVELSGLIAELGETYQAVAEDRYGKRLVLAVAPEQRVHGDAQRLKRLLVNLIENALKYGGPTVTVTLRPDETGAVVLKVADDGPGIPQAERANVLKRFYRLDGSRSSPGTGLGLAIVEAIARLHRAELTLGDAGPGLVVSVRFAEGGVGNGE